MHIQLYFITNSLFRHQKLASNLHFLRLAQLFFLFATYSVSFLQKAYFYAKKRCTKCASLFATNLQGSHGSLEFFHAVGVLPLHAQVLAAHVAVGGQLAVDGLAQVEMPG